MHKTNVSVLGGGSWGTALAQVLAQSGHNVYIVIRRSDEAQYMNREHRNPRYVSDFTLSSSIIASSDSSVLKECSLVVLAIPCQNMRDVISSVQSKLMKNAILVNAAKGLEVKNLALPSMIVHQELPAFFERYATLSGPSFAHEVLSGKPTAVVIGCADTQLGAELRGKFSVGQFRTYSCEDIVGVELGGAVKNVIAIAAGISDGLGFGNNARAALITRGIAEITRLGVAMGARLETFMGLSGLGDLALTCAGDRKCADYMPRAALGEPIETIVSRGSGAGGGQNDERKNQEQRPFHNGCKTNKKTGP